jgi:hypothetical protein
MVKEAVDFYQYVPNLSTPTCFGIWLPSSGGRKCLISYSSNVLCYGRVQIMTRPVWPAVVEYNVSSYVCCVCLIQIITRFCSIDFVQ